MLGEHAIDHGFAMFAKPFEALCLGRMAGLHGPNNLNSPAAGHTLTKEALKVLLGATASGFGPTKRA